MKLTADEIIEITNDIKGNLEFNIPNASQNEQNYYLRGVIDALSQFLKSDIQKT